MGEAKAGVLVTRRKKQTNNEKIKELTNLSAYSVSGAL